MSLNRAARVLVVGLDMGDGPSIRQWIRSGDLPHFADLVSGGTWLELQSTAEVLHTSTWPTFATGTLPGRHGVYYPYQPAPGHQLSRHIQPDQYGAPCCWTIASRAGRRAIVYDIPETFPDRGFEGRGVFDWGTWAWYGTPASQPARLAGELKARFGAYPLGYEAKRLGFGLPDRLQERLLRSVRYKAATTAWLLDGGEWDLAVVGLCETHPAGHYLWPVGAEAPGDDRQFDPLRSIYKAIDEAIGRLRASVPADTTLIVVSGDGIRPNRCGWHLLPAVMQRLGWTVAAGADANGGRAPQPAPHSARDRIPASARRMVNAMLPWRVRDRLGVWLQTRSIDWARTRAFTLPTDLEGCIRLNVKGREPFGSVEQGAQYEDVCEEIRQDLAALENPATGRPAVRHVWVRNEIFPGDRQEWLPDLVVTWNDEAPIEAVTSERVGLIEGVNADPRPGTHSTSGFALAAGPAVARGMEARGRLVDLTPSVLSLLGIDSPPLDGRPLEVLRADATSAPRRMG
jgi:predicted AlkP superfamily phosphohydrolase/phosphomutase